MELIGVSERRYFHGGSVLGAIFLKEDGSEFDMSITMDQLTTLMAESGQVAQPPRRRATPRRSPVQRQEAPEPAPVDIADAMGVGDDDDDFDPVDGPTIRLATFPSGHADDEGGPL